MRLCGAALVLFLSFATAVAGEETSLELALTGSNEYYGGDRKGGAERNVVKISPLVRLNSRNATRRLFVSYVPGIEIFTDHGSDVYWNHRVAGEFQTELNSRTSLTLKDVYSNTEIVNFGDQILPDETVDVVGEASRFIRNNAEVILQHMISPLWNVNAVVSHNFADFQDPNRHDSETVGGGLNVSYALTVKDMIGLGVQTSYSTFDGKINPETRIEDSGQRNTNVHLVANFSRQLTERLRVEVSGGPNLGFYESEKLPDARAPQFPSTVDPAAPNDPVFFIPADCPAGTLSSCVAATAVTNASTFAPDYTPQEAAVVTTELAPVPNPSTEEVQVNFFGSAGISYLSDHWAVRLTGRRVESTESGIGTSTAVTSVTLGVNWELTPEWLFTFNGGWTQRTSLAQSRAYTGDINLAQSNYTDLSGAPILETSSVPTRSVAREVDRQQYRAWGQVRHRVARDWWVRLTAEFIRQETERFGGAANRFRIGAGVTYDLPAIRF